MATVSAERVNPSADLLTAWMRNRLKVEVVRKTSRGPGITAVEMQTAQGPIRISRPDGRLATYSSPGHPDRPIALRRRDVHELLSEELRRLDPDDVYAATAKHMAKTGSRAAPKPTKKSTKKARAGTPNAKTKA